MRFLVVGAGAVGCFVGAKLACTGAEVMLVGRQRLVEAVTKRGLIVTERGVETRVQNVTAASSVTDAFYAGRSYDLTLLTVKSYDTVAAVTELKSATAISPPPILSLQNGVGNEEAIAAAFGSEWVIAGVITTPVAMPEPGWVEAHRGRGHVVLAPLVLDVAPSTLLPHVSTLLQSFRQGGLQASLATDWRALKWTKLLLNVVGNATSAILDWTPQQIFANPRLAALEVRALREALAVMRAQGISPVSLGGYPVPLLAWAEKVLPTPLVGYLLGRAGAGGRGGKMPSLHVDLSTSKRKSEVEWLNGAVVRKGKALSVPTPINHMLTHTLMGLVRGDLPWEQYRHRPERLLAAVP
ncbi:MAG: ketopantoate reductase family protein [Anaerolineae bacterium]|nr:ketopantoate reductase family protein [Anaerolineae bacterium]